MGPAFFRQVSGSYATLALTGTFAAATVGSAYSSSIPISGGLEPYSLTGGTGVASGALDAGFSLSITGTTGARFLTLACASPATADTMSFTASVDSADGQTATSAQSVEVSTADPHWATVNTLLHFDGANGSASYVDETGQSWLPVGTSPLLTTADFKFGPSGLALPGTGWLRTNAISATQWTFGANDLTIEAWIKPLLTSDGGIISRRIEGPGGWALEARATGAVWFRASVNSVFSDTAVTSAAGALTAGVWQHVALCRNGNEWTIYVNGVSVGTSTLSGGLGVDPSANTAIGASTAGGGENPFKGTIDELRVNNGHCYYTGPFTPPTQPFVNHA